MAAVRVNASSPAWWHGWSRHGAVARPRSGSHRAPRFQAVGVCRTADRVPSLIPPLRSVKRRDATRVSDHEITRRLKGHDQIQGWIGDLALVIEQELFAEDSL